MNLSPLGTSYKWHQPVIVLLWLAYPLSTMSPSFRISFLRQSNILCIHILFILSFIDRQLGCSPFLAMWTMLLCTGYININLRPWLPFFEVYMQKWSCLVVPYLIFWQMDTLFSTATTPLYIPNAVHGSQFQFRHILHNTLISVFLFNLHPRTYLLISVRR